MLLATGFSLIALGKRNGAALEDIWDKTHSGLLMNVVLKISNGLLPNVICNRLSFCAVICVAPSSAEQPPITNKTDLSPSGTNAKSVIFS